MAEKIKIFQLDIDVDAAIQSQADLKHTLDGTRESLKELKDSGDTTSRTYVEMEAKVKNLSREYNSAQTQLGKLLKIQGEEIKTVEQGEAALTIINKEWSKQASLFGVNSKEADTLAKKHKELKDRTNELRKGIGDTSSNIGNYSKDMQEALGKSNLFGKATAVISETMSVAKPVVKALKLEFKEVGDTYKNNSVALKGYNFTQRLAATGSNIFSAALKVLRIALISTGIGAIIILLGSLIAFFTQTQKGIDFVNQALAGFTASIDVVTDRLSKMGGGLAKLFKGDIKGGIEDITTAFSGMGDEIQREVNLAIELERVLQRVERAEINLDIRRSAANSRLKELKLFTDDTTKSTKERIEAAKEFQKIETSLTAEQIANQEKKVAALLGFSEVTDEVRNKIQKIGQEGVSLDQLGLSESTVEDMKSFRDEATKLFDLQSSSYERQTENQNKLNTLVDQQRLKDEAARKENIAAAKKSIDASIADSKTRIQLFIEENKGKAKTLSDNLKFEESVRDKRLAILKDEINAGKKTQTEAELERLRIKNEFLEKQKDLTIQFANEELQVYKDNHKTRIENNQQLTDLIVDEEQRRLDLLAEKNRDFEATRLEQGVINQQEYNAAIDAINEENRLAKVEAEQALKDQQAEAKAIDFENRLALEQENYLAQQDLDKERIATEREAAIAEAEKTGADISLIKSKYADQEKQIEANKQAFKTELAAQTFGNLATILGKETKAGKAAAIAQTTIDTYLAAQKAYQSLAGIPIVGPALGAIAAGAAIASGIANVRKITSTKEPQIPQAAKGITLSGPSHSGGGINLYDGNGNPVVNAEGDENVYVVNKRASRMINNLDYINQATGGAPLSRTSTYAAAGGMIQTRTSIPSFSNQSAIDYDLLAMKMAQANMSLPRPVVSVEDINTGQNDYAQVVNGANI